MKRYNNQYEKIYSLENLQLADKKARKGKSFQRSIQRHDRNNDQNLLNLQKMLQEESFKTSPYTVFKICEPKEREIYRLPYYPDRIVHHAIMNVLKPIFVSTFTADSYSCIKGKGIKNASDNLKAALKDRTGTMYCLKLDIKKFYPSIKHSTLKLLLMKKFKDQRLLQLLFGIIDSAPGVPIGNYLSQYFANFYLTYFDHWIKEVKGVKHYFRYADDIVILGATKNELHQILAEIKTYLSEKLSLSVKGNYQVFPVESRGIDFLGYVFFHTHTYLRKEIKKSFARAVAKKCKQASIASYMGWAKHSDSVHLLKKLKLNEAV